MTEQKNSETFRSGFIAVVGRPNVGKSTLINHFLGQKVAAVSPRPQTTRRNQLGIITDETSQIIFIDTPGIHKPMSQLGKSMNSAALGTLQDVDAILWMVDLSQPPTEEDQNVAQKILAAKMQEKTILVLNKIDTFKKADINKEEKAFREMLPGVQTAAISSRTGLGCDALLQQMIAWLPEGPAFYDPEQITDLYEREIAADLIRESLLNNLDAEIPHAIAVRIDNYIDRTETNSYIEATLLLERESHKSIVIGKNGDMIKKIGQDARKEIEKLTERKIYIDLKVKVMRDWRNNAELLRSLGYAQTTKK